MEAVTVRENGAAERTNAPSTTEREASQADVTEGQSPERAKPESTELSPKGTSKTNSSHSKHPIHHIRLTWLLALTTIALFTLTVIYAFGTTGMLRLPSIRLSVSFTILVLRVLSEFTGLCMVSLINSSLERVLWMLAARDKGVAFPGFLALSPSTGKLGMANLFLRGFRGGVRWSLLRFLLVIGVPALGIVILSRINAGLVFDEYPSFPIAGGIGEFDPSQLEEYRDILALQVTTDFKNFLQNPQLAVSVRPLVTDQSSCLNSDIFAGREGCGVSAFVHGGLPLITPPPVKNASLPDAYVYLVRNMQGMQLDFAPLASSSRFDGTRDCVVVGNSVAAVQFCVSAGSGSTLDAKYVHCPIQISVNSSCLSNRSWQSSTGWSTSMTVHRRSATVYFSRYNFSTVSIRELSNSPDPVTIPPAALLAIFNTTFSGNALGFSSNTPGQQFIFYLANYLTFAEVSSFGYNEAGVYLRNLLALPLYYFQPTYLSNTAGRLSDETFERPDPGLPAELYTQAAFADPSFRVEVARWSVWVYTIGGSVVILLCLVGLVLGSVPHTVGRAPETSLWALLDFVAWCDVVEESRDNRSSGEGERRVEEREHGRMGLREPLLGLKGLRTRDEPRAMAKLRVFVKA